MMTCPMFAPRCLFSGPVVCDVPNNQGKESFLSSVLDLPPIATSGAATAVLSFAALRGDGV